MPAPPKNLPPRKPTTSPNAPNKEQLAFKEAIGLHQRGRLQEAKAICEALLRTNPKNSDALYMLGGIAYQTQDYEGSARLMSAAIALNPQHFFLHHNHGIALEKLKQFDAALASFDEAIRLQPNFCEAHFSRANVLHELEQWDAAVRGYDQAIRLRPDFADAYSNRGNTLQKLQQWDAAIASLHQAISLKPDFAQAHCNLGNLLQETKQSEAALACYDHAIRLQPDLADAHYNRGNALVELTQIAAAVSSFDEAIRLKPDYPRAHMDKSFALLLGGNFAQGWPCYEWRWKIKESEKSRRNFDAPLWLGDASLQGKTILLYSEQGLGDTIQFIRYAKMVAAQGAHVICEVPKALLAVLQGVEGVHAWVEKGAALPPFDFHCPLLSLPLAFNTELATIPHSPAYLHSDPHKLLQWQRTLGPQTRPRVGLVWSGSTHHTNDRNRSIELSYLLNYLPAGLEYISLQKEVRDIDKPSLEGYPQLKHFGHELHDFSDTAALCTLMDMVVCVDTSVAHLSGALGKKTWLLLSYRPDWRWLLDTNHSPWYPSVTLYRQNSDLQWHSVLEKIKLHLSL